ncbi:hypothetical protein GJAV_G00259840 [Gymnothorax javanicus]|nr:hypothetical protein GJAV_G00259840 [Gymnothorax javanicus]
MRNTVFTYLILCLTTGPAWGRVVRVTEGPVMGIEGQSAVLRCSVWDYEGPSEQDFDWNLLRGGLWLPLISTFDLQFADQSLRDRVDSGDITVERRGPNSVELLIGRLTLDDSTTFRCSTPSTDSVIRGSYEADTRLTVIPDSLRVAPVAPPTVVAEGALLELYCNATRDIPPQGYTHLSITWSVERGAGPEDMLSFGPDGEVMVGANHTQRYAEGGLRLALPGGGVYGMVLTEALPGDGGVYSCTAGEWSREAGGGWRRILQRGAELGEVQVTPTAQSLSISVGAEGITLAVGETLNLTCSVSIEYQPFLGLEVTWLRSPAPGVSPSEPEVLAQLSRDGVVKGTEGRVEFARVEVQSFQLLVRDIGQSDSGRYSCQVQAWIRRTEGEWYQAALNTSDPVRVQVTVKDPSFQVVLLDVTTPQFSGEPTELECRVKGVSGLRDGQLLGVTWLYAEATPGDVIGAGSGRVMAMLDGQGNLKAGEGYEARVGAGLIALSRAKPDVFKLRLLSTRDADMGAYSCAVSVWSPAPLEGWEKGKEEHSKPLNMFWTQKTPRVSVAARRLREVSAAGSTFEMSCQVNGQNLQDPGYSVLIQVEETVGGRVQKILALSPDAVLELQEWSELDRVVLEKTTDREFRFRLQQVQRTDRGFYYCSVTAWTREPAPANSWIKSVSAESNKVHVNFADKGPVFNISIRSDRNRVSPGETAKMQCVLSALGSAPDAEDVLYEVRWFLSRVQAPDSAALLAAVDRWGVVRKGQRNSSSDCSLERMNTHTFTLSVHNARDSDAGEYYCTATPWTRPNTGAWTRGRGLTSARIYLSISFAVWDSMRRPLLVGAGVSLAVGVLSVLLGLLCTHCCCRDALRPTRTHDPPAQNHEPPGPLTTPLRPPRSHSPAAPPATTPPSPPWRWSDPPRLTQDQSAVRLPYDNANVWRGRGLSA